MAVAWVNLTARDNRCVSVAHCVRFIRRRHSDQAPFFYVFLAVFRYRAAFAFGNHLGAFAGSPASFVAPFFGGVFQTVIRATPAIP